MSFTEPRIREINRQFYRARIWLIVLATVGFVINAGLFYAVLRNETPQHALMEYSSIAVESPAALCPGETLVYRPNLVVNGPGVFTIDTTIWRITPPATIVFSETPLRAIFDAPIIFTSARRFVVPPTWRDPDTGESQRWEPGQYELRRAISTTSRNTEPSIATIRFSIREDCP